ncbi:MAG: quinone-dependent dihydroorotate dehydrogenase [Chloroflexaceae bacterium]
MIYQRLLRPLLFRLTRQDAEVAHERAMRLLAALSGMPPLLAALRRVWAVPDHALEREVFGVRFPNPLGLAAGFDKDGQALPAWAALGFGFVEVGTVTWHAQPGNPRPRLFRLPDDAALINRMGFNNHGAAALAARLQQTLPLPIPLGISLGKSRQTDLDDAVADYCASLRALYPYGDYFAVNVSSPNTPGLRSLQDRAYLDALLAALQQEVRQLAQARGQAHPSPLLVKIAPDLSESAIAELLTVCADHAVSGIIAVNTTLSRAGLRTPLDEAGGLSGRPLAERACQVVQFINRETGGQLPIIGVGGIFTADDARRMLDAGASLLQVYTGFVYVGPGLARTINRGLSTENRRTGN